MHRGAPFLAGLLLLGACSDDRAATAPADAGNSPPPPPPPSAAAASAAAPLAPPAGELDLQRIDQAMTAAGTSAFPAKCPKLGGSALLLTVRGIRSARRIAPQNGALAYQEDALTPTFLRKLATARRTEAVPLWAVIEQASHVGLLVLSAHTPAQLFDAEGKEITDRFREMKTPKTFRPGRMDGWLFVIERATGTALCKVSAVVTNKEKLVTVQDVLREGEALDDRLRRSLVQALATKLSKASGASLVDETGPVHASPTYQLATSK